ncbi:Hypothetical protein D9617_14g077430 [Elsinoe fawcettii]|nr:Hypothetical protein D9617_14g077430 [Elsinoe fawcettii]
MPSSPPIRLTLTVTTRLLPNRITSSPPLDDLNALTMERTVAELPPTIHVTLRDVPRPLPWTREAVDGMGLIMEVTSSGTLNLSQVGRPAYEIMVQWAEDGNVAPLLNKLPSKTNVAQLLVDLGMLFETTCGPFGEEVGMEVRAWLLGRRGFTGWDLRCVEEVFDDGESGGEEMEGLMVDWFFKASLSPLNEAGLRRTAKVAPSFVAYVLGECVRSVELQMVSVMDLHGYSGLPSPGSTFEYLMAVKERRQVDSNRDILFNTSGCNQMLSSAHMDMILKPPVSDMLHTSINTWKLLVRPSTSMASPKPLCAVLLKGRPVALHMKFAGVEMCGLCHLVSKDDNTLNLTTVSQAAFKTLVGWAGCLDALPAPLLEPPVSSNIVDTIIEVQALSKKLRGHARPSEDFWLHALQKYHNHLLNGRVMTEKEMHAVNGFFLEHHSERSDLHDLFSEWFIKTRVQAFSAYQISQHCHEAPAVAGYIVHRMIVDKE